MPCMGRQQKRIRCVSLSTPRCLRSCTRAGNNLLRSLPLPAIFALVSMSEGNRVVESGLPFLPSPSHILPLFSHLSYPPSSHRRSTRRKIISEKDFYEKEKLVTNSQSGFFVVFLLWWWRCAIQTHKDLTKRNS